MKTIISCDDGSKLDLDLAILLKRYNLPCIFFIPSNCELTEDEIRGLSVDGFQIGGHTVSHPEDMKLLYGVELLDEIKGNKDWLEWLTNTNIDWFCYPKGKYNDKTVQAVKMAGFKHARTTVIGETEEPVDNYRIKTSVHVYPNKKEYDGKSWLDYAKRKFDEASFLGDRGVFHIWMHSWELTKFNLWKELEELFKYITK